jgi:hypothetical protein
MLSSVINLYSSFMEIMVKKEYRGCEWDSPIYRQIIAEKKKVKNISEFKTKRGKRSKKVESSLLQLSRP